MPEKEEKPANIPWLPLVTLIGLGSGIILFFPQLVSSRPGGGDPRLAEDTFDDQTVDARLWQDPLGVAIQNHEKEEKGSAGYAVKRFQELFISKCVPESKVSSSKNDAEKKLEQVTILGVMIPGGPYVEDIERRLRSRRAVIEALGSDQYEPEKDHKIGYFSVYWTPLYPNIGACVSKLEIDRSMGPSSSISSVIGPCRKQPPGIESGSSLKDTNTLIVPYEWFEPAHSNLSKQWRHVLVLWLVDEAFQDAPLARVADLVSWFKFIFYGTSGSTDPLPLPAFKILGPDNSGTLRQMVLEARQNLWSLETRDYLAATRIYSSQATAAEAQLLSVLSAIDRPCACKNFIERRVKERNPANGFSFFRTIILDDRIVGTLQAELGRRGINEDDDVAIISEADTYYARALSETFAAGRSMNVHSYRYLRGIDGKLPGDNKSDNEGKTSQENNKDTTRPTEQTEGQNQADDIRRLAERLRSLNSRLQSDGRRGLMAVGLLGSDVYDKLELLRALRPVLPEAKFFTNHLDARFAHPDELKESHNLIVVSENDLFVEASPDRPQEFAPFRDSSQTGLFQATLEAIEGLDPKTFEPKEPLIFEIGRNGPVQLNGKDTSADSFSRVVWPLTGILGSCVLLGLCLAGRVAFGSTGDRMSTDGLWNYFAIPMCAFLAAASATCFYFLQNTGNNGEHFAWLNGTSAWPSIALMLFAGFLSIYFIVKVRCDLKQNATKLADEFGLPDAKAIKRRKIGFFKALKLARISGLGILLFIPRKTPLIREKVEITVLWRRYREYGLFWRRMLRVVPMTVLYLFALGFLVTLMGGFPRTPIRGFFPFPVLIGSAVILFVFLTFLVIDAIALHESFLNQLAVRETRWPQKTFKNFPYPVRPNGPYAESDLADYWDVLFIARRTEAIGNLIYYPFIVLSLLILSRLSYFANWTWNSGLVTALSIHFLLALYAAWRLPKAARQYREIVLERMEQRRREDLTDSEKKSDASEIVMQDVRSTHQGAFAYLWEQPAVRALLFPSGGLGLTTLMQWLLH